MITGGVFGWESIEYKELFVSACEYLGDTRVVKHALENKSDYLKEIKNIYNETPFSHAIFDPRTTVDNKLQNLFQAVNISFFFFRNNITPIVVLTDFSVRNWRIQASLVSAVNGLIICYASSRKVSSIFPHNRVLGPYLMPFSIKTANELNKFAQSDVNRNENSAIFTGSLYEPRKTILNDIDLRLQNINPQYKLTIRGRELGSKRIPDSEYWRTFLENQIVITTSSQINDVDNDWSHVDQMVYRYLEVCACGGLLVAPMVEGLDKYFDPNVHFVSFSDEADAANKIAFYFKNPNERKKISDAGLKKAHELINSQVYWLLIDSSLGKNSLK